MHPQSRYSVYSFLVGRYSRSLNTPPFLMIYSCGQTMPSNLLTDFLGLRKASELVDNDINGLLLISFINSNQQNFQK